jgi:hypothetical protein
MKKICILLTLLCFVLITGCSSSENSWERECEIYEKAYKDGYNDAVEEIVDELPWTFIDKEELEDSLYKIFEDGAFAEEVRDQIQSYCEIYSNDDFEIDYSDTGIDYNF